ncbi:MAG: hypothetical protein AAFY98_06275, partial [Verrucomicrobiota bacterium]
MKRIEQYLVGFLGTLGEIAVSHPKGILLGAILTTAVSGWVAFTQLGVVNNVNDLIREDAEIHRHYLAYKKEFDVREEMVLVVRSDDHEANRRVVDELGVRLAARTADFTRVYYHNDYSRIENRLIQYGSKEDLKASINKLNSINDVFDEAENDFDFNSMLSMAVSRFDEKTLRQEAGWESFKPYIEEFVTNLNQLAGMLEKDIHVQSSSNQEDPLKEMQRLLQENEYITIDGGRTLLVLMIPTAGNEMSFSPFEEIIQRIRADMEEVRKSYPEVKIGLTGEPV